mmetsp:Transcript_60524/g.112360  ORF Transcript_60524/g.112360 Transcript_60524/m.112360 type:complete len:133 (-) Transcript_60524:32-430(-)
MLLRSAFVVPRRNAWTTQRSFSIFTSCRAPAHHQLTPNRAAGSCSCRHSSAHAVTVLLSELQDAPACYAASAMTITSFGFGCPPADLVRLAAGRPCLRTCKDCCEGPAPHLVVSRGCYLAPVWSKILHTYCG